MNLEDENVKDNPVKSIKPINVDTVHKICSGQVVLSLAVAVKELVENALDAGATNIDVRLKNYGTELIEVSDNGSGVTEDNFAALTLKHHTSKLNEYSDLLGVSSYGFRGEALSSLCALASLTITTRHQNSSYATKIEYDHKGYISKKTPCSRQVGTTVSLTNLFYSLPVRQKEFHKNVKREFNKMTQLLYAYCLISTGVRITCNNQTSSNAKSLVVATQGSTSYKDNIACVFGLKQLQTILEIKPEYVAPNIKDNIFKGLSQEVDERDTQEETIADVEIDLSEDSNDAESKDESITSSQKSQGYKNVVKPVEFTGFISSCAHGSGRSSTDRQFYYVNSRPCEPTKIMKLVNEIYKQYNPNQYPFVFLNVNMERTSVDVNVTPDKRKIFLTQEKIVLDVLKNSMLKVYESIPRTLKIDNSQFLFDKSPNEVKPDVDQPRIFTSFLQKFSNQGQASNATSSSSKTTAVEKSKGLELKRKSTTMLDFISSKEQKTQQEVNKTTEVDIIEDSIQNHQSIKIEPNKDDSTETLKLNESATSSEENNSVVDNISMNSILNNSDLQSTKVEVGENSTKDIKNVMYLESTDNLPPTQIRDLSEVVIEKSHKITCKTKTSMSRPSNSFETHDRPAKKAKVVTDKEDLGKNNRRTVHVKTSLEHIKSLMDIQNTHNKKSAPEKVKFKSEINPVFNKKCEEELSREISKDSFMKMSVIGQFNLGFIITRLEDDLFIIDQHATDEIYNFETLQKTTELTSQKLVIPQQLELTGVNEQILMDNLEVFKKNGFTFEIDADALPTKRVKLLTIPMSKNWIFGKDDIEELLFMLRESPSEQCRPSRVRAMFASRACRKSVMIGTALANPDMKRLVEHMAEIDQPWNCPHGRPTIRHLVNLAMVQTKDE
ncbi:histidine kinase-, DNA gyrase b-, and HSP90-like ATPase domain-containing protein [Phthorimaea operculella]|nr:histidine kinase-, DNA gyrase b-, and HSP90-like ATPase domain-containing protein [Phthorimaea operculella]